MNKVLYVALILGVVSCSNEKESNSFTVDGTVKNSTAKMVYLQESPAGAAPIIIDSSALDKNGSFELTGTGKEESIYSLRPDESQYPFAVLINDAKKITVNADLMNNTEPYIVKGSAASQGIIDFDRGTMVRAKSIYDLSRQVDSLMKAKAPDSIINVPFSQYEAAAADLKTFHVRFYRKGRQPCFNLVCFGKFSTPEPAVRLKGIQQYGSSGNHK